MPAPPVEQAPVVGRPTDTPALDFEVVLNALPLGVVLARRDGVVVFRNRAATAVVGLRHVDLLVEAAVDRLIRQTSEAGAARTETLELFGPPPRVLVVSTVELADGVCLAVIEDISERTRIDAVRTDFVANISHELEDTRGGTLDPRGDDAGRNGCRGRQTSRVADDERSPPHVGNDR